MYIIELEWWIPLALYLRSLEPVDSTLHGV